MRRGFGYQLNICCKITIQSVPHRKHIWLPSDAPTVCREIIVRFVLDANSRLCDESAEFVNVTAAVRVVTTEI